MILSVNVSRKDIIWIFQLLLKILLIVISFWYILQKTDSKRLREILVITDAGWLFSAVFFFTFSKLLASFRLNIYFRKINIHLSDLENIRLYWLGMFYNLFLPGSVGGDAYKVIRLSKDLDVSYKKVTAAVLLDRLSGLAALILLLCIFWIYVFNWQYYSQWVMVVFVLVLPVFYLAVRIIFPYLISCFWSTFVWGIAVQVFQIVSLLCILNSLHIYIETSEYILIFLAASVMAVLPFTIGGLGAREMVFLWGAQFFKLDLTISVMVSALFFGANMISSSPGIIFLFLDPLKTYRSKILAELP